MNSDMPKTKVLIVSPAAFLPDWQGSRKRVGQMIDVMESYGFEVHFMFIRRDDQLDADADAMSKRLNGRFVELADKKSAGLLRPWYLQARIASRLGAFKFCNINKDAWYFDDVGRQAKEIIRNAGIDIVMLEYQYYSKLFETISGVVKIIDMHDVFADRYKEFLKNGRRPFPWYSVSADDERKVISRADLIIAIQNGDEAIFRSYGHDHVLTLAYAPKPRQQIRHDRSTRLRLCFLGTGNAFNISALEHYLHVIHPAVLSAGVDYELVVIGGVCEAFRTRQIEGNVTLLGKVSDLDKELQQCDALVNSLASGTGLPIKVLDALASGLHILATEAGVRGLPMLRTLSAVKICSDTQDWIDAVKVLHNKKQDGVDLAVDAFGDLNIIQRDIEISRAKLYSMLADCFSRTNDRSVRDPHRADCVAVCTNGCRNDMPTAQE